MDLRFAVLRSGDLSDRLGQDLVSHFGQHGACWLLFVLIAFVYAPIMSFVSARLDGLVGREISIPYVEEAIRFMTGFRGVEIWFVPFPTRNFGGHAEQF